MWKISIFTWKKKIDRRRSCCLDSTQLMRGEQWWWEKTGWLSKLHFDWSRNFSSWTEYRIEVRFSVLTSLRRWLNWSLLIIRRAKQTKHSENRISTETYRERKEERTNFSLEKQNWANEQNSHEFHYSRVWSRFQAGQYFSTLLPTSPIREIFNWQFSKHTKKHFSFELTNFPRKLLQFITIIPEEGIGVRSK